MTNQTTNPPKPTLRDLIANDSFGAAFQTMAQYRAALLKYEATHPSVSAVTSEQIDAGAAVTCECGKPLGRNLAIDVHDAMERAQPYATGGIVQGGLHLAGEGLRPFTASICTCPSGDGSLRWPCDVHPPAAQTSTSGKRQEGGQS